jgi:hypothetical protein
VQSYRFLITLLVPLACLGTSIVRISLEETVTQAQWIVDGDVVRNWCGWDSGHRFIWTHTEIAVRQPWKGSPGRTVTVSEPGGIVNGMGMQVAGMVRYSPGEHVVVFLYRTPIGLIRTVGLSQGKLQVDSQGLIHTHPTPPGAVVVNAAGANPGGTSIGDLESRSLRAVHDRIAHLQAVRP